jgi:gluconolactonase
MYWVVDSTFGMKIVEPEDWTGTDSNRDDMDTGERLGFVRGRMAEAARGDRFHPAHGASHATVGDHIHQGMAHRFLEPVQHAMPCHRTTPRFYGIGVMVSGHHRRVNALLRGSALHASGTSSMFPAMQLKTSLIAVSVAGLLAGACGDDGSQPEIDARSPDASTADGGGDDAAPQDASAAVDPLEGIGMVTLIEEGFMFTEGPLWLPDDGVLLFSDVPGNTIHRVLASGAVEIFRMPSGNANGLALDKDGLLLAAEHGNRRVSRSPIDGAPVDLATEYEGQQLNSPNDITVRSDGTIYFTDPPYGIQPGQEELDFNGLFRIPAAGGEPIVEWEGAAATERPNGLVLSLDERHLYVADSQANVVRRFAVAADGDLTIEDAPFISVPTPDGMELDTLGNLFIATADGVCAFAPDGTLWGTIEVPRQPSNVAFGGSDYRTLYITAREAVYQVQLANPGKP